MSLRIVCEQCGKITENGIMAFVDNLKLYCSKECLYKNIDIVETELEEQEKK